MSASNNPNMVSERENISINAMIEAVVKRSCIVDFGIVTEVPDDFDGLVTVALSVASTPQDIHLMTCVLANIASSALTVNIKPVVGDKVLVVYPRLYDDNMFTVPEEDSEKTKIIVNERAHGYTMAGGMAFLFNQLQGNAHHNIIDFRDGELSLKLAYSKDDEENLLNISTDKDGAVSFDSHGNTVELDKNGALSVKLAYSDSEDKNLLTVSTDKDGAVTLQNTKSEIKLDKDGYLSYKNTNDDKTQLQFTSSGMTMQDKNGCKIVSSSQNISINGKLTIKK